MQRENSKKLYHGRYIKRVTFRPLRVSRPSLKLSPRIIFSKLSTDYFSNPRHDVFDILEGHYETVLDVGCGSGAFGSLLKNRGKAIRVVGIDASESALAQASLCLDLAILHDLSNGLPKLDEKFDLISLNDVLEHLITPEKY